MKILLTGFEPFGGEPINPAFEILKTLPDTMGGNEIIKRKIPVSYVKSTAAIEALLKEEEPDMVLSLGQAGGAWGLRVEKVGLNLRDARSPDNDGHQASDEVIFGDGDIAYYSTLPVKAMVAKIRSGNVPAAISYSAGPYVCNNVLYSLLYLNNKKYQNRMKCGFIHVPYFPGQIMERKNMFYMAPEEMTRGLTLALEAMLEQQPGML